jgi:membrane protein DedA with SNARE-associated domain
MTGIVETIVLSLINLMDRIGLGGLCLLMSLESACIPIPSEAVMPAYGNLAAQGRYSLFAVGLVGAVGCLIGSLVAYYIGLYLGRPFVMRFGRYFFLKEEHLTRAELWFAKHGDSAAFFSRLLPVVRTFISLPAGMGKMDVKKFAFYSFIGSVPWTFALAYLGFILGEDWKVIFNYNTFLDAGFIIAIVAILAWYIIKHKRRMKNESGIGKNGAGTGKDGNRRSKEMKDSHDITARESGDNNHSKDETNDESINPAIMKNDAKNDMKRNKKEIKEKQKTDGKNKK